MLIEVDRSSARYVPRPDRNGNVLEVPVALARPKPRWGYRRLWAVLSQHGHEMNVTRLYRLYRQAHLGVRRLKRKLLERAAFARA